MSIVMNLAASIALSESARQEGIEVEHVLRVLRRSVRRGHAKTIAEWLFEEETRVQDERSRRKR